MVKATGFEYKLSWRRKILILTLIFVGEQLCPVFF